jgi:hypothetical protein
VFSKFSTTHNLTRIIKDNGMANIQIIKVQLEEQRGVLACLLDDAERVQAQLTRSKSSAVFDSQLAVEASRLAGESKGRKDQTALIRFQDRIIEEEFRVRGEIERLERQLQTLERMDATPTSMASLSSTGTALSLLEGAESSSGVSAAGPRQMTLASFLLRKDERGNLKPLSGPKFLSGPMHDTCEGCDRTFKNSCGSIEHRRHCKAFQELSEQRERELAEIKRERLADEVAQPGALSLAD